jgi:hypothetical protein
MIVRDAHASLASHRDYATRYRRRETVTVWSGAPAQARSEQPAVAVVPKSAPSAVPRAGEDEQADEMPLDSRTRLLRMVLERLMGIKARVPKAIKTDGVRQPLPAATASGQAQGWGLRYELEEVFGEAESTSFGASGSIVTADGKRIAFRIELTMSREFERRESVSLSAGDALSDPLVINFGSAPTELSGGRVAFDLDCDGGDEDMPFVGQGSGFLVLDRDSDGAVDDGSELFGPASGDGFRELAAHDADGSGWIDEADAVSAQLRVWSRDGGGRERLQTLQQAGVAAIYLGRADTKFDLRDGANRLDGQVASTGVYLRADGAAGTIQQVNLSA